MFDQTMSYVELASRESDGISVSLLWLRGTDRVHVAVRDGKRGHSFDVDVRPSDSPMDVFHHPYAYSASETSAPSTLLSSSS
jgi:hypothetical protein